MGPKLTQAEGFILGVGANIFKIAGPRHRVWGGGQCSLWGYLLDMHDSVEGASCIAAVVRSE